PSTSATSSCRQVSPPRTWEHSASSTSSARRRSKPPKRQPPPQPQPRPHRPRCSRKRKKKHPPPEQPTRRAARKKPRRSNAFSFRFRREKIAARAGRDALTDWTPHARRLFDSSSA